MTSIFQANIFLTNQPLLDTLYGVGLGSFGDLPEDHSSGVGQDQPACERTKAPDL